MANVTIKYGLSEAGRRASLLAGGNGKRDQEVAVPATPELIAIADVGYDGSASIEIQEWREFCGHAPIYFDAPLSDPGETAIAAHRELVRTMDEKRAEKAAKEAAERAERLALERAAIAEWMADPERGGRIDNDRVYLYDCRNSGVTIGIHAVPEEERATVCTELVRRRDRFAAEAERFRAEEKVQVEAEQAVVNAAKAAVLAWVAERDETVRTGIARGYVMGQAADKWLDEYVLATLRTADLDAEIIEADLSPRTSPSASALAVEGRVLEILPTIELPTGCSLEASPIARAAWEEASDDEYEEPKKCKRTVVPVAWKTPWVEDGTICVTAE